MTTRDQVRRAVASRRRDGWTSDDEARLVRMRDDGASWDDIAQALRRTPQAVALRAFRLGITDPRPRWTPEEDEQLIELRLAGWTWTAIADALGRSRAGCIKRAWNEGWLTLDGVLGETYGQHGTAPPPLPLPEPEPVEWLLIVDCDGWRMSIARGDRAEIERIYRSMWPKVAGLRIEAA